MDTLRRAVGNSTMLMLSQVVTWTSTLILMAAVARGLGDEGFGHLFLAMSFAVIFGVLVDFGLDQFLARSVARQRELAGSYLINSLLLKSAMAVIAYLLLLLVILLFGYPPEVQLTIAIYCIILWSRGVSSTLTAMYQAVESLFHSAIGNMVEKVTVAAIALVLLAQGYGVISIAFVYVVGSVLGVIWKAVFLRTKFPLSFRADFGTMRVLASGALPFFLYWSLASVYYRIDGVMLSVMTSAAIVGWYGAAYRLFDTLVFLPNIVATIMFPILSRVALEDPDELRSIVTKGVNVILVAGLPICTGLFVLAEPIIGFIYGRPEFLNAAPALQWLAVALFVLYLNAVMGVLIISLNKERKLAYIAIAAIVVNTGLNWLLIPHFQHVAAAATTLITELLIFGYFFFLVPKHVFHRGILLTFGKATAASALMGMFLLVLVDFHLLLLVPLGALVYAAAALLLRLVQIEDIRMLTRTMRSRQPESSVVGEPR